MARLELNQSDYEDFLQKQFGQEFVRPSEVDAEAKKNKLSQSARLTLLQAVDAHNATPMQGFVEQGQIGNAELDAYRQTSQELAESIRRDQSGISSVVKQSFEAVTDLGRNVAPTVLDLAGDVAREVGATFGNPFRSDAWKQNVTPEEQAAYDDWLKNGTGGRNFPVELEKKVLQRMRAEGEDVPEIFAEKADKPAEFLDTAAREARKLSREESVVVPQYGEDEKWKGLLMRDLPRGLGQVAGMIATAPISGLVIGSQMHTEGANSYEMSLEKENMRRRDEGLPEIAYSEEEKNKVAAIYGAAGYALEKVGLKSLTAKLSGKTMKKKLAQVIAAQLKEGGTESAQGAALVAIQNAVTSLPDEEILTGDRWNEFIVGSLVGGAVKGGQLTFDTAQERLIRGNKNEVEQLKEIAEKRELTDLEKTALVQAEQQLEELTRGEQIRQESEGLEESPLPPVPDESAPIEDEGLPLPQGDATTAEAPLLPPVEETGTTTPDPIETLPELKEEIQEVEEEIRDKAAPVPKEFRVKATDIYEPTRLIDQPLFREMDELGKLKSKTQAKGGEFYKEADFEQAKGFSPALNAEIYGGTMNPADMASALYDRGAIDEPTPDALWRAIAQVQDSTVRTNKDGLRFAKNEAEKANRNTDFQIQTESKDKGDVQLRAWDLNEGAEVTVAGEKLTVTKVERDEQGYPVGVILKDGPRFERQEIAGDEVLFVEKVENLRPDLDPSQPEDLSYQEREATNKQPPAPLPQNQNEEQSSQVKRTGGTTVSDIARGAQERGRGRGDDLLAAVRSNVTTGRTGPAFAEEGGDLLSGQTEDFALAQENTVDGDQITQQREASEQARAEQDSLQGDLLARSAKKRPEIEKVRKQLEEYFEGEIPSNIEVIHDPDADFDAKAEGSKITINSSLSEDVDLIELLEHEMTHTVEEDAEVQAILDELEGELDAETLREIDEEIKGLYANDEISSEVRARGVAKALKKARDTTAFQKLVARIKEILGLKSDARLIRLAESVIARARANVYSQGRLTVIQEDGSQTFPTKDGRVLVGPARFAIKAHHGTPHKVDKFTTAAIGTGEGAQAYGWGLYFAQDKTVGEFYRNQLSDVSIPSESREAYFQPGQVVQGYGGPDLVLSYQKETASKGWNVTVIRATKNQEGKWEAAPNELPRTHSTEPDVKKIEAAGLKVERGHLYTVNLKPDESELLDWDKPLSEQSELVRNILSKHGLDPEESIKSGRSAVVSMIAAFKEIQNKADKAAPWVQDALTQDIEDFNRQEDPFVSLSNGPKVLFEMDMMEMPFPGYYSPKTDLTFIKKLSSDPFGLLNALGKVVKLSEETHKVKDAGKSAYNAAAAMFGGPRKASEKLAEAGIKGIKFLDGSSRANGEGFYNYVIFDDSDIEILEENGDPVEGTRYAKKKKTAKTQAAGKKTGIVHKVENEMQITDWVMNNAGLQHHTSDQNIQRLTDPSFVADLQAKAKVALGLEGNATFVTSVAQMLALDLAALQFTRDGDTTKLIRFHNAMARMGSVNLDELMTVSDASRAMRGRRGKSDAIVVAFNAIKEEQARAIQSGFKDKGIEADAQEVALALEEANHNADIDPDDGFVDEVVDEVESTPEENKQTTQARDQVIKALKSYVGLFQKVREIQARLAKFAKKKKAAHEEALDLLQDFENKPLDELMELLDKVSTIADQVEIDDTVLKEKEKVKRQGDKAKKKGKQVSKKKYNKAERVLAGIHTATRARLKREGMEKEGKSRISKLWKQYIQGELSAQEYQDKLVIEGVGAKMAAESVELGKKEKDRLQRRKKVDDDARILKSFQKMKEAMRDLDIEPTADKKKLKQAGSKANRDKTMDMLIRDQQSEDLNSRRSQEEWVNEAMELGFSKQDAETMFATLDAYVTKADALSEATKAETADLATQREIEALRRKLDKVQQKKELTEPAAFVRKRIEAARKLEKKQLSDNPFNREQFMAAAKENGLTDAQAGEMFDLTEQIARKRSFTKKANADDRFMDAMFKFLAPSDKRGSLNYRSGRTGAVAQAVRDWVKLKNSAPTVAEVTDLMRSNDFSKDDASMVYNQIMFRRSVLETNEAFATAAKTINNLTSAAIRAFIYNNDVKNMSRDQRVSELASFLEQAANLSPAKARNAAQVFSKQFERKMKAEVYKEIRNLRDKFGAFGTRYLFDDQGNFLSEVAPDKIESLELIQLIEKAIALNVASPDYGLAESFAALNGWNGFKTSELQRLAEIAMELKEENLTIFERQQLLGELSDLSQQFIKDATLAERVIEYYRSNILSGASTIGVNLAALFERSQKMLGQVTQEMQSAKSLDEAVAAPFRVMGAYFRSTLDGTVELAHSWKSYSSYTMMADHLVVRKQASKKDWEKMRKIPFSSPGEKMKFLFLGFPSQVSRMLNALDSSTNFAESRVSEQLMTIRAMKDAGLTKEQVKDISKDVSNVSAQAYDTARAGGMTTIQAKRYAMDVGQSYLIMQGQKNGVSAEEAATIHEASLETAKSLTGTQTREGLFAEGTKGGTAFEWLSSLGMDMAASDSKLEQAKGVGIKVLLPIFAIPANIAHRSLDHAFFGGYGALRLAKARKGNPRYKLLAENQQLYNQRKAEIIAGSVVQAIATVLWALNFLEDDEDEKWLRINASSPKDFEARKLWEASGRKAFTIQVRTPGSGWANLEYTRGILQPLTPLFYAMGNAEKYKFLQNSMTTKEKKGEVDADFNMAKPEFFASVAAHTMKDFVAQGFSFFQAIERNGYVTDKVLSESGDQSSNGLSKAIAVSGSYKGGGFIPVSGMLRTFNKLTEPRESETVPEAFLKPLPIVGGTDAAGGKQIDFLGNSAKMDGKYWANLSNRVSRLNMPVSWTVTQDQSLYEPFLRQNNFPAPERPETFNSWMLTKHKRDAKEGEYRKYLEAFTKANREQTVSNLKKLNRLSLEKDDSFAKEVSKMTRASNKQAKAKF